MSNPTKDPKEENKKTASASPPPSDSDTSVSNIPTKDLKKITLVGPSNSGKTFLLAALGSAASVARDALEGEDAVARCSFVFELDKDDADSQIKINLLRSLYEGILDAAGGSAATAKIFRYRVKVSHSESAPTSTAEVSQPYRLRKKAPEIIQPHTDDLQSKRELFQIVDGRGGDLTSLQYRNDPGPDAIKFIDEHYGALLEASGALICLPWRDGKTIEQSDEVEVLDGAIDGLERLIKDSDFCDRSLVENLAVCITKYELAFLEDGSNAYKKALNTEATREVLRNSVYSDLFDALRDLHQDRPIGKKPRIRVFPCSTFGFVEGKGASNYYPSQKYPGLLTRSVSRQIWQNDPEIKAHFPQPISNTKASAMWMPFNLGSPSFFAATGKVTGPLSFSLDDLL